MRQLCARIQPMKPKTLARLDKKILRKIFRDDFHVRIEKTHVIKAREGGRG
jgi:hypothetical protein